MCYFIFKFSFYFDSWLEYLTVMDKILFQSGHPYHWRATFLLLCLNWIVLVEHSLFGTVIKYMLSTLEHCMQ